MTDILDTIYEHFKFLFAIILIFINVILISVLVPETHKLKKYFYADDIQPFMIVITKEIDHMSGNVTSFTNTAANNTNKVVSASINAFGSTINSAVHSLGRGTRSAAFGVDNSAGSVGHAIGHSTESIANAPNALASVIRPAKELPVVIISPQTSTVLSAQTSNPPVSTVAAASGPVVQDSDAAAWPLRGRITTAYGVYHWPFQARHSGIDISSGKASGVMPIQPIKSGKVVQTVYSKRGLGNYVIVDHGGGITAYYCHLHSIKVSVGQVVGPGTALGTEGSTGVSTGTHLHLEIRQDGKLIDPRKFITGNPY